MPALRLAELHCDTAHFASGRIALCARQDSQLGPENMIVVEYNVVDGGDSGRVHILPDHLAALVEATVEYEIPRRCH